jgi:hypothetical protein
VDFQPRLPPKSLELISKLSDKTSSKDEATGKSEQCLMRFSESFVAHEELFEAVKPGNCAFHHPPMPPQPFTAFNAWPCDPREDSLFQQEASIARGAVSLVCIQLLWPFSRTTTLSCDGLDAAHHPRERFAVVEIGRRERWRTERDSVAIGEDVVFAA